MKKILIFLLPLLLSACASPVAGSSEKLDSGVEVQVLIGPMCPVIRIGQECPDQPYQANLIVLQSNEREVMRFQTDEQGRYKADLAPGEYVLRPEPSSGMPMPRASEQNFVVEPHKFTQVTVNYDSGIR